MIYNLRAYLLTSATKCDSLMDFRDKFEPLILRQFYSEYSRHPKGIEILDYSKALFTEAWDEINTLNYFENYELPYVQ